MNGMKTSTKRISEPIEGPGQVCSLHYAGQFADQRDVPMHSHEGAELVLITAGRCAVDVADGPTLLAEPGTLCVVPAGAEHNQRHFAFTRSSFVSFRADHSLFDDSARTVDVRDHAMAAHWLNQMVLLQTQGPDMRAVAEQLLHCLVSWVDALEKVRRAAPAAHPALARAVALIRGHLFDDLPVARIAHESCVSAGYLTALFVRRYGVGPGRYQQQLRMDHARQLLAMPYLSVSQISRECGYDDPNYFGRLFKQHAGASPRRFRAMRLGIRPARP